MCGLAAINHHCQADNKPGGSFHQGCVCPYCFNHGQAGPEEAVCLECNSDICYCRDCDCNFCVNNDCDCRRHTEDAAPQEDAVIGDDDDDQLVAQVSKKTLADLIRDGKAAGLIDHAVEYQSD